MSGLVQRYNGSNISYTDSRFTGWNGGVKKLCVRTKAGNAASDVISYPLTTNATANQYCHFVVRVNGSNCRLATRHTWTATQNHSSGSTTGSTSATYQCVNGETTQGYVYQSSQSVASASNTLLSQSYGIVGQVQTYSTSRESYNYGTVADNYIGQQNVEVNDQSLKGSSTSYEFNNADQRSTIYSKFKGKHIPFMTVNNVVGTVFQHPTTRNVLQIVPMGTIHQNETATTQFVSQIGPAAEFGGRTATLSVTITSAAGNTLFGQKVLMRRYDGNDTYYYPNETRSAIQQGQANTNLTTNVLSYPRTQQWAWSYGGKMGRKTGPPISETWDMGYTGAGAPFGGKVSRGYSATYAYGTAKIKTCKTSEKKVYYNVNQYGYLSTWKVSDKINVPNYYTVSSTTWGANFSSHNANI